MCVPAYVCAQICVCVAFSSGESRKRRSNVRHFFTQLCYKIDVKDGKKQPAHEQIPVSTDLEEGLFSVGPVVPGTQSTAKVMNVKLAEASVKSANKKSSLISTRWHATVPTRSSSSSSSNSYGIVSQERDIGERLPDTLVLGSGVSRCGFVCVCNIST